MGDLKLSMMHYGVGLCVGVVLMFFLAVYFTQGFGVPRKRCVNMLYLVGILDIGYSILKIFQLDGIGNCGIVEDFSVLIYIGVNFASQVYLVWRFVDVYGYETRLNQVKAGVGLLLAFVFFLAAPISMANNKTSYANNACSVNHPEISSIYPTVTVFIVSAYLLFIFLHPLIKSQYSNKSLNLLLGATSTIALVSTCLFNATLSTSVGNYASMTSMLDLAINMAMFSLPYIIRLDRTGSTTHHSTSRKVSKRNGQGKGALPKSEAQTTDTIVESCENV